MATFIHIFPAEKENTILKTGIKAQKIHYDDVSKGVFCMPVINDFYASHQWVREIMRRHKNVLAAYFRVPDKTEVHIGKYNGEHKKASAAEALSVFQNMEDKMGFQVIIPCPIPKKDILRIKKLPPMGWRYYPAAKGDHLCLCPACISGGGYGDRKLLTSKLTGLEKKLSQSLSPQEQAKTLSAITELMGDHKLKLESWETVIDEVDLSDKDVVCELGYVLLQTNSEVALNRLIEIFKTASTEIKVSLVEPILLHKWDAGKSLLDDITNSPEVKAEIERFYARFDERE